MKRSFFVTLAVVSVLACGSACAEDINGEIIIETDKSVYRVGDTVNAKITVKGVPLIGPGGRMGPGSMFPELTSKNGTIVEKIAMGNTARRGDLSGNRREMYGDERVFTVPWKIEDKEWKNVLMDETIYTGPGFEAGFTLSGSFVYCLRDIPGEYEIRMVRMKRGVLDPAAYKADPNNRDQLISNTVKVKILPRELSEENKNNE